MFWIGVLIGLFVGAFLGLFFGGLLAAARRGDDLVAATLNRENATESTPTNKKLT